MIHNSEQQISGLTRAFKAIASEARLAPAPVGSLSVHTDSVVAALVGASCTLIKVWNWKKPICTFRNRTTEKLCLNNRIYLTYTVIFAVDVFQIIALLALAVVAAKGVHTLSVVWAEVLPSYTLVNI